MNTMDEDELEGLLSTKTFAQLSEEERDFVLKKLGSEEQYHAMRRVTLALITSKVDLSPDPDILASVQKKMQASQRADFSLAQLFSFKVPGFASVLVVILAVVITWFVSRAGHSTSTPSIVEVTKHDTVFVTQVRMDTIYKTRVVYRRVASLYIPDKNYFQVVQKASEANVPEERSVSMKDKQELEMLLVSGSE